MRVKALLICAALLVVASAAPAEARRPNRYESEDASANAFWYQTEQLSKSSYQTVVTYVGVYESSDGEGAWADVYRDVERCRVTRRGEDCQYVSEFYADAFLSPDQFSIAEDLSSAHLDAVFELYSYDDRGRNTGSDSIHVVTDWSGVGEVDESRETYTFHSDCFSYRSTYDSTSRSAEATGSVDEEDLGQTSDAWLGYSSSRSTERTC
jgi:hypothetical protein